MPVSTECAAALLSFRYPSYVFGRQQGWKSRQFGDWMLKAILGFHSLTLP